MTSWTEDFLRATDRFTAVVDGTTDWDAPSPCERWAARDVVDHVVSTERDYLEKHGAALPEREAAPAADWHAHADAVRRLLADRDFAELRFDGYFGPTTIEELLGSFYGFDLKVHRWDLALAGGRETTWDDTELEQIETAAAGFGDRLYADGVCRPALPTDDDADRQTRLLAVMGRAA